MPRRRSPRCGDFCRARPARGLRRWRSSARRASRWRRAASRPGASRVSPLIVADRPGRRRGPDCCSRTATAAGGPLLFGAIAACCAARRALAAYDRVRWAHPRCARPGAEHAAVDAGTGRRWRCCWRRRVARPRPRRLPSGRCSPSAAARSSSGARHAAPRSTRASRWSGCRCAARDGAHADPARTERPPWPESSLRRRRSAHHATRGDDDATAHAPLRASLVQRLTTCRRTGSAARRGRGSSPATCVHARRRPAVAALHRQVRPARPQYPFGLFARPARSSRRGCTRRRERPANRRSSATRGTTSTTGRT